MTDLKPQNGGQRITGAGIMAQAAGHRPASEATSIEQSRAVAQVQGALVVARQHNRDEMRAMQRVREACQIEELAAHAFFSYERAGSKITGPSIHLSTELARCWGNVDYGISELRRDEERGESEMLAYSWDLETNTRVTNSFIVPHKRDKRGGAVALVDMRDIYENNANHAARRLRECIFRVLPKYVVEEAKKICHETLQHGGGEPLPERREKVLKAYAKIGISRRQIEKRIGNPADKLTPVDIANLRILYGSIQRGELDKAEEFPPDQGEEISAAVKGKVAAKTEKPAAEPEPADHDPDTGEVVEPEKPASKPNGTAKERAKEIAAAIRAAPNADALRKVYARLAGDVAKLPQTAQLTIAEIYDEVLNRFPAPEPATVTDADRAAVASGHHFDDLEPEEWRKIGEAAQPGEGQEDLGV